MTATTHLDRALKLATIALTLSVGSCALDPVHDGAVKALGPEDPAIPQGPFHRQGQPCAVCHSVQGPAKTTFVLAGTIFYGPGSPTGADQASVRIIDATGAKKCFITNCKGNFFVRPEEFPKSQPIAFPLLVSATKGSAYKAMASRIGREASCANCHRNPRFFDSPGQVRLYETESQVPKQSGECPPVGPPVFDPDACKENFQ